MDKLNFVVENMDTIVLMSLAMLGVLSQALALFGKPKIAKKVGKISTIIDGLAGNYKNAKNKDD